MKKTCIVLAWILALTLTVVEARAGSADSAAQVSRAMKRFPGFEAKQLWHLLKSKEMNCVPSDLDPKERAELLRATQGRCAIPLPTWLPEGFRAVYVNARLGEGTNSNNMALNITYIKKLPDGKKQVFTLEALFEFGDIPYTRPKKVATHFGPVDLYYEPVDDSISADKNNWGKKTPNYVITDLFCASKACYPRYAYSSIAEEYVRMHMLTTKDFVMITEAETKKILASMELL